MLEPDLPSRRGFIPLLLAPSSDNGELRMEALHETKAFLRKSDVTPH